MPNSKTRVGSWPIQASPIRSWVLVDPLITHDAIIEQIFFLIFIEYKRITFYNKLCYHINTYLLNVNTNIEHKYFYTMQMWNFII